jgi:hypothetical protein
MIAARILFVLLLGTALNALPSPWQGSFGQGTPAPSPTPMPPARVTTDTPEYCRTLALRIEHEQHGVRQGDMPALPPLTSMRADEVAMLSTEGRRMCDKGLVLGGIARLRRAWMLLHYAD